jgi:type III secretory pathway lipoprotein EscJ
MESLQQVGNDLVRRLRELPRRTQVLIAIVAVLCLFVFAFANRSGTHGSVVDLLPGTSLTARQLPAFQIAFAEAGLENYRIEEQRIYVPEAKKVNFMAALSKANLLTATSGNFIEKALDASSPFENQLQRKQRIKIAQEKEFAQIISQLKGIEEATVQYDAEEKKGLRQQTIYTASVTVRATNNQRLTMTQALVIRNYLAGCIAGLGPEKIYIVDLNQSLDSTSLSGNTLNSSVKNKGGQKATDHRVDANTPQKTNPFATGTLAIVGSALIAGCIALLRRKNISTEESISPTTLLDIEVSEQTVAQNKNPPSETSAEHAPFDEPTEVSGWSPKARLLLPGQSDYSHLVPDQQTNGIELTTLAITPSVESSQTNGTSAENSKLPFEFVYQTNPDDLFEILTNESPEVIAIVFSHLPPEQSALVLKRLQHPVQLQVLKSLGNLNVPSKDMAREIGKNLAHRLESLIKRNEKRKAGIQAVGDLLEFIDVEKRSQILDGLHKQDAEFASRLKTPTGNPVTKPVLPEKTKIKNRQKRTPAETMTVETPQIILRLSGEDLCTLFAAVDPRDAVLALSHWDGRVTQRLTSNMQSKDVLRLQKSLENVCGQSLEIATSFSKVLEVATRLSESGKIISSLP